MADVYSRLIRKSGLRIWYAECYYWADGRRRRSQRSTGVRDDGSLQSRRTAELNARDIEQSLALGKGRRARPTTLTQAIDLSVERKELEGLAQATIDITIEKAKHLFEYFKPKTPIADIDEEAIKKYVKVSILPPGKRSSAADPRRQSPTLMRELQELALAFTAAGLSVPKMPSLKPNKPRERWLPPAEQLRLLLAMSLPSPESSHPTLTKKGTPRKRRSRVGRRDHATMYLHLGLSKSELYRIDPSDCDFNTREVRIRGTKTEPRDRVLPMTPEVQAILWSRLSQRPMFEPWSKGSADRDLKAAAKRAGLERCSFNDLRRSYCTILCAAGTNPLHLQKLMGHADLTMISRVYARVGQGKHMHDAIKSLPRLRSHGCDTETAPKAASADTSGEGVNDENG